MSKKILHITAWYPTYENLAEALWIQRHIETLEPYFEQEILHLKIETGPFRLQKKQTGNLTQLKLILPTNSYRIKEIAAFFVLFYQLLRSSGGFDIVNFHIAYPNLVYLVALKRFFKAKWVITEHWSAYHFHFHSKKKLRRIKNIFRHDLPLITVSENLLQDIEQFSDHKIKNHKIIPNAVNTNIFKFTNTPKEDFYLLASFWKSPKNPLPVFRACHLLLQQGICIKLKIIGYGPMISEMNSEIKSLILNDNVEFLGYKNAAEIADYMNRAKAFIMPSEYETFSAITAEALCCGLPVIASDSGALSELINKQNGLLVTNNNWQDAIFEFENKPLYHCDEIAREAAAKFSYEAVGRTYAQFLNG